MPTRSGSGEDARIAADAFTLAVARCEGCRDYHAVRPYLRLSGNARGTERHDARLAERLRLLAPPSARVLIAGAAEGSTLLHASMALGGVNPLFTVIDRCQTPLELCCRVAASHVLAVETRQQDLGSIEDDDVFDLVLAHRVLGFLPPAGMPAILARLCRALRSTGRMVLVVDTVDAPPVDAQLAGFEERLVDLIMGALAAHSIAPPEPRAHFIERLRSYGRLSRDRQSRLGPFDATAALLTAAGLVVEHRELLASRVHAISGLALQDHLVVARRA